MTTDTYSEVLTLCVSISISSFLHQPMRTLTASILIVLLLSACGLKGPLYLPQKESPSPQPQPQSQPQQSQDEEKDK